MTLWRQQTSDLRKSKAINSFDDMKLCGIPEHDENKFIYLNRVHVYCPFFWTFLRKQEQKKEVGEIWRQKYLVSKITRKLR